MTRNDIIRMARESGIDAESDTLCRYEGWVEPLERFAVLVAKHTLANIDPSSFMSWQEGYAAGAAAEREACAKLAEETVCDTHLPTGYKIYGTRVAKAIRERSNP